MAMVSFGHPVRRQDAKEKPLQTQKKTNHRGIMSRPTMTPCAQKAANSRDYRRRQRANSNSIDEMVCNVRQIYQLINSLVGK